VDANYEVRKGNDEMQVVVKKLTKEESVIEVETKTGIKTLTIQETQFGHSYDFFADWVITDDQYNQLEEFVDGIIKKMSGKDNLEVTYDL